jgi:hypothetical protein
MIERLESVSPQFFTAIGPKFDLEKTLTAMFRLLNGFLAAHTAASGAASVTMRVAGEGGPWRAGTSEESVRAFYRGLASVSEVDDTSLLVEADSFRFRLQPLGTSLLFCGEGSNPVTVEGLPWHELDPSPCFTICRNPNVDPVPPDGGPRVDILLTETQRRIVGLLLELHEGLGFDCRRTDDGRVLPVTSLYLPHARYGAGHGTIRIPRL